MNIEKNQHMPGLESEGSSSDYELDFNEKSKDINVDQINSFINI